MNSPGARGAAVAVTISKSAVDAALRRVEEELMRATQTEEPLLERMARQLIEAGGKRLRPRVCLLAYAASGGEPSRLSEAVAAATAAELIHTASLVHDDIIDQSPLRRGLPTVHVKHGVAHALLVGDFLFTRGFGMAGQLPPEVVAVNARACVALAEGELLEQRFLDQPLSEELYVRIITKKTAEPIRACAVAGALLADPPQEFVEALGAYGLAIGIAFQIADDILDIAGEPAEMGKVAGQDARTGVVTLPAGILGLANDTSGRTGKEVESFRELARRMEPQQLREMLEASGAIDRAREAAQRYVERAKTALDVLPPSPARNALAALAERVVNRRG